MLGVAMVAAFGRFAHAGSHPEVELGSREAQTAVRGSVNRYLIALDETADRVLGEAQVVSDASDVDPPLVRMREAGHTVDHRRFRMLFMIDGVSEHEEDTWHDQHLQIGQAQVRISRPVDRCVVITRHPETSERDFDALRIIKSYRGMRQKYIDFGMFASVERPGVVQVGDTVRLIP